MQYKQGIVKEKTYNVKLHLGKNIIRLLLVTAICIWMMVIFGFSAANAEESQSTSDKITEVIVEVMYENYDLLSYDAQQDIWNNISFLVRKTGHFGEYAILAILVSLLILTYQKIRNRKAIYYFITIIFCCVYAMSDEFHQGFVSGRSPMVRDVVIDTTGAFVGALLVRLIYRIVKILFNNGKRGKKI